MPVGAARGAVGVVFGLVALEAVRTVDHSTDLLITHRNLNLAATALMTVLAVRRSRVREPSWGYLAAGLAGLATVLYSAYLGGHMVYEHGVGVSEADGVVEERAPEITSRNLGSVARAAGEHLGSGLRHTAEEIGRGELAPGFLQASASEGRTAEAAPA
jgi:hypothetical protein